MEEVKRLFRPEFLNRIDETIVFHALDQEHMKKRVGLLCRDLTKRAKEQLDITIVIRDSVKKHIVEKGTNVKYGARPLRRAVQTELEDKIAEAILNGELTRGMEVEIGISKDDIKFYPKEIKN
jgi:ATP-dependent Clp protease ATP-binding subunit ClpC